jgi:pSer/pThr/pTyr-binding forkhead associated (FHA) protein
LRIAEKNERFSPTQMNDMIRKCIALSNQRPCYLEVSDEAQQFFLFFREKQIYSAGKVVDTQLSDVTIKDFLIHATQMKDAYAACCEVNSKILHSLLIIIQKKPTLKLLTSLVDLDQVLDKIEEDNKSCIVSATQDEFLAVLRYEKGKVTALAHEQSMTSPKEQTFRDDFLVRIYTLSAEQPLTINVYEDLLVKYSADAKMIDNGFNGDITEMYLSKPPMVMLEFKGKEIGTWILDKPVMNIGRTADNDIVIDNLAVSRLHAVLEKDKGNYYVRDCDSLNGTLVNDKKVGRAKLHHGDEIVIGKHKLRIHVQGGTQLHSAPNDVASFDQTVIMTAGGVPMAPSPLGNSGPRLVERTKSGEVVIEISKATVTLGKDKSADVSLDGLMIAKHHAEIAKENGQYVIRHLNGRRKVSVGGKTVKERVLKDNDAIKIANREFIFQE